MHIHFLIKPKNICNWIIYRNNFFFTLFAMKNPFHEESTVLARQTMTTEMAMSTNGNSTHNDFRQQNAFILLPLLSPAFNQLHQIFWLCIFVSVSHSVCVCCCCLVPLCSCHTPYQTNAKQITNNNWWRTIKLSPFYFKCHEIKTISITNSKKEFLISVHF